MGTALSRLCRTATAELGLTGAVVTVMTTETAQAVAGCSDEASRRLEEIQFAVGEGPGTEVFGSGRPVLVADLSTALGRWPGYAPEAVRAGICAVFTFPVQLGAARFGVLTCYVDRPRTLNHDEVSSALVLAELATELLLDTTPTGSTDTAGPALQKALHFRTEIYQAQGMVMVQLGVSLVEALALMRAHAFGAELSLTVLALGILDGTILVSPE